MLWQKSSQLKSKNSTSEVSERLKVARDLHDTVAQEIAALGYLCDEAISLAPLGHARDSIAGIRHRLSLLSTTLRDEIGLLREPERNLGYALTALLRELTTQSEIRVSNKVPLTLTVDPDRQLDIYRAIREIITNIFAHSGASNIHLTSSSNSDDVKIEITDDGVENGDFEEDSPFHFGLAGVRERISAVNGTLHYHRDGSENSYKISIPQ